MGKEEGQFFVLQQILQREYLQQCGKAREKVIDKVIQKKANVSCAILIL